MVVVGGTMGKDIGQAVCVAAAAVAGVGLYAYWRKLRIPAVKLVYFDIRGLAETARYAMAVGGVPYEDARYPLKVEGPGKFVKKEMDADADAGKLDLSLKKLPLLVLDGVPVCGQSKAIERYIARKAGLMGATEIEELRVDAVGEFVRDFKDAYQKAKAAGDKKKAAWFKEGLPESLAKFEKVLANHGTPGYAVGSKMSLADIQLYVFVKEFFDDADKVAAAIDKVAPCLKAIVERVGDHPKVKAHAESRPVRSF